jgi:deazaflavin-dependent oxidoreductase (nitroreductase family)
MAETSFTESLGNRREVQITTIGRRSGRQISLPVWFVHGDGAVLLLPVYGSDTNWYRNVLEDPTIKLKAGRAERSSTAVPITEPTAVGEVVDAFRAKYGPLESYYPKTDVAVEVPAA